MGEPLQNLRKNNEIPCKLEQICYTSMCMCIFKKNSKNRRRAYVFIR